jgi:nucleoporin NDC1
MQTSLGLILAGKSDRAPCLPSSLTDSPRSYERPKLNERPVLLRSQFISLALAQATVHLYRDYDLIRVPQTPSKISPIMQLKYEAKNIISHAAKLVSLTCLFGPFFYFVIWRDLAWALAFRIGRILFFLPKATRPSGLTDPMSLFGRFIWTSMLLVILWELSNHAFTIYTSQEPVKKDKPLTADSRDPNGSLISGLRAKKEIPKTMAFWELAMITQKFDDRRKTLFGELDRQDSSTWSQISTICLVEIQSVSQRIQDSQGPIAPPAHLDPQTLNTLPKISSRPVKEDAIFRPPPRPSTSLKAIGSTVGSVTKSYGQSHGATNPASPLAHKLLEYSADRVLTKEQQEQFSRVGMTNNANGLISSIIRTPLGMPFRQPLARRIKAVVFGVPFSSATIVMHAVQAICGLAVASLKEDNLGQVQKDISTIMRVLMTTTQQIQVFVERLPPHWTDVDFDGNRRIPEVEALLTVLRDGLHEIIETFGEYADNLGLSRREMSIARELAGRGPEMESLR